MEEALSEGEIKPYLLSEFLINAGDSLNQLEGKNVAKSRKTKKILVVEDNRDLQKYLETILGNAYTIVTACNGREGLEKAIVEKPDLILADVMMPEMDGNQMTEKVKSRDELKGIPVLLLTAKANMAVEGFKKGADDYIVKPFDRNELAARINAHLMIKELRDELIRKNKELENTLAEKTIAQKQLAKSEKRFREMAENLPNAIVEMDLHYKVTFLNHYGRKLFKATEQDMKKGILILDYVDPTEKEKLSKDMDTLFKTGKTDLSEYKLKTKDGSIITVLIKSTVIEKNGTIFGIRSSILETEPVLNTMLLPDREFNSKHDISERESEILLLLIKGASYKEIGEKLFITYKTVDKHVAHIYKKTGVKNRLQLLQLIQKK
jgi:PAS domain S-box-containing protein